MSAPLPLGDTGPHRLRRGLLAGIATLSLAGASAAFVLPALGHVPGAEVQVVKSSSVSSVAAGGEFDYKLIAFNTGDEAATGVVVTDDLADTLVVKTAGWIVNPPVGPGGTCTVGAGNVVSCDVGNLAASDGNADPPEEDSAFVRIHVQAPKAACGTVDNSAVVSASNEPTENTHNNTSNTVAVTVTCGSQGSSASTKASQSHKAGGSPEGSVEAATPVASASVPNTATDLQAGGGQAPILLIVILYVTTGASLFGLALEYRRRRL